MKRILDFCQQNKYAIIWTACYAVVMWSILFWLFNFNMFSATQWRILAHAELRGFPGFVFGILILAAVPMYIATTSIVVRTKKPLFKIPLPKFMTPVPIDAPTTAPAPAPSATDAPPPAPDTTPSTPAKTIPAEVRAAFTRAREHSAIFQKSAFDPSNADAPTARRAPDAIPELQPAGELPLPPDFDTPEFGGAPTFAPVFSDINFDGDAPTAPAPQSATILDEISPMTEYLFANGTEFTVENGLIFTDRDVIAVHNDPDFWIADNENWFAAGKQKPSPADAVLAAGAARGVRPVLYLAQTNILDLDARRAQWASDGITVITNLDELK